MAQVSFPDSAAAALVHSGLLQVKKRAAIVFETGRRWMGSAPRATTAPTVIVTQFFWRTFLAAFLAYLFAYLPFVIAYSDGRISGHLSRWWAFGESVEHGLASAIAVAAAGVLTYMEWEPERARRRRTSTQTGWFHTFGSAGAFAGLTAIGAVMALYWFMLEIKSPTAIKTDIYNGGVTAWAIATNIIFTSGMSFLTVIQVRRDRDTRLPRPRGRAAPAGSPLTSPTGES
jgi:hypothetical protein